jgi:hypothetical protein
MKLSLHTTIGTLAPYQKEILLPSVDWTNTSDGILRVLRTAVNPVVIGPLHVTNLGASPQTVSASKNAVFQPERRFPHSMSADCPHIHIEHLKQVTLDNVNP